jgi:hypothetical protein
VSKTKLRVQNICKLARLQTRRAARRVRALLTWRSVAIESCWLAVGLIVGVFAMLAYVYVSQRETDRGWIDGIGVAGFEVVMPREAYYLGRFTTLDPETGGSVLQLLSGPSEAYELYPTDIGEGEVELVGGETLPVVCFRLLYSDLLFRWDPGLITSLVIGLLFYLMMSSGLGLGRGRHVRLSWWYGKERYAARWHALEAWPSLIRVAIALASGVAHGTWYLVGFAAAGRALTRAGERLGF